MTERTCIIDGCDRQWRSRKLCDMHYRRWLHHGDPMFTMRPNRSAPMPPTPEAFWERTAPNGACLEWIGRRRPDGYGRINWRGRQEFVHRIAFSLRMGRWPEGILRHLCNNPPCVLHVVEGTHHENNLDTLAAGRHRSCGQTHCKHGHPFDEANTYLALRSDGSVKQRMCRACFRERQRRYRSVVLN